MKVFMLGWEFPPYMSGGLGTACYGLTKGLDQVGVEVSFVLPMSVGQVTGQHVSLRTPATLVEKDRLGQRKTTTTTRYGSPSAGKVTEFEHLTMHVLPAIMQPYATPANFEEVLRKFQQQYQMPGVTPTEVSQVVEEIKARGGVAGPSGGGYGGDMLGQVRRYALLAVELAKHEDFDVVHAHDWMTYPAGLAVAAYTGKPLVIHVHSTEFDRSGEHVWQQVYDIERAGMHGAKRIICVSHWTKNIVVARYNVDPDKVEVVYNAVELPDGKDAFTPISRDEKIVLFLGRITMQKGPEYFLLAARKVIEKFQKVRFIIAGSGELITKLIEMAADLGIGRYVTFTGFLRGKDVDRVFRMADLYVMPSVSEPFGIAPLEAMIRNVPVIISKQSGVSEVLTHALKVDFWDVEEMANQILAVLRHPPLQRVLRQQGALELRKLSWRDSADRCREIYEDVAAR